MNKCFYFISFAFIIFLFFSNQSEAEEVSSFSYCLSAPAHSIQPAQAQRRIRNYAIMGYEHPNRAFDEMIKKLKESFSQYFYMIHYEPVSFNQYLVQKQLFDEIVNKLFKAIHLHYPKKPALLTNKAKLISSFSIRLYPHTKKERSMLEFLSFPERSSKVLIPTFQLNEEDYLFLLAQNQIMHSEIFETPLLLDLDFDLRAQNEFVSIFFKTNFIPLRFFIPYSELDVEKLFQKLLQRMISASQTDQPLSVHIWLELEQKDPAAILNVTIGDYRLSYNIPLYKRKFNVSELSVAKRENSLEEIDFQKLNQRLNARRFLKSA